MIILLLKVTQHKSPQLTKVFISVIYLADVFLLEYFIQLASSVTSW